MVELLEREAHLAALRAALTDAAGGSGRVVLVSGEAGIGKTLLVERFIQERAGGIRLFVGACDSLFTPRPLGPLYDIADQAPGNWAALLNSDSNRTALFSAFLRELQDTPTLVVFEDVHWADEATLDLIKYLGRRIQRTSSLFVVTYRDDELGPRHPLRSVLGDLAGSPAMRRVSIQPLSESAVRTLAVNQSFDPAALHQQTGGNPFFITEVLASGAAGIPPTVRDAILTRAARLSASGRAVLEAAAVIGAQVEPWLLETVVGAEASAMEECMTIGMLQGRGELLAFQHEIARQTILDSVSPPHKRVLHRLVLDALSAARPTAKQLARLAYHAAAAGDREAVLHYSPAAARQAAANNAHRQSAAHYANALRFAVQEPPTTQALLLEAYAAECDFIDDRAEVTTARRTAQSLWHEAANPLKEAEAQARLAGSLVLDGQNAEAERASQAAIAQLETFPAGRELALAYHSQASLRMLNRDSAEAIDWGQKAISLAEQFNDLPLLARAYNTIGSAALFLDYERGCSLLERSLTIARQAALEVHIASALMNLGSGSGELYQFKRADQYLAEGMAYAAERDLDANYLYMLAWQALSHLYQGRWNESAEAAAAVLHRPGVSGISRIMALVALGRLRTRRGDPGATTVLDEALQLALQTGTLQRLAPVRAAQAEAAWLAGTLAHERVEDRPVYELAASKQHPWFTGELAYWRWRAGEPVSPPDWIAVPFGLQIAGDWRAAADAWEALGCPYEQATALADGDQAAQLAALSIFEHLGAGPAAERLRQHMRQSGVRNIPRGPRPETKDNPFGLTARQMEIIALLVEGLSNIEIAARLHISAKTVDHHVSAVLAKLDVHSREEAAALAVARGLTH